MREESRLRLGRMTARYERQRAEVEGQAGPGDEASFFARFGEVAGEVLAPLMRSIGAELGRAGHDCRVEPEPKREPPQVEMRVLVRGRRGPGSVIRFVCRKGEEGWEVIAELDRRENPVELGRFGRPEDLSVEVCEQLLIETIEQVFAAASASGGSR
jgi:hypothetical protein